MVTTGERHGTMCMMKNEVKETTQIPAKQCSSKGVQFSPFFPSTLNFEEN